MSSGIVITLRLCLYQLRMCMSCHCFVILLRSANHIFQTSQVEESKIGFHTIGKNKTTPDGTDESNFHPEAEMRYNADYTRRVCQSLVGSVAESNMRCRFLVKIIFVISAANAFLYACSLSSGFY